MARFEVSIDGRAQQVEATDSIRSLTNGDAIAAILNHHLVSLDTTLEPNAEVTSVLRTDPRGRSVLRTGTQLAFQSIVNSRPAQIELEIGQSLLGGYFYDVKGLADITTLADELNLSLQRLIDADEPFVRTQLPLRTALAAVKDQRGSRHKLLRTWPTPRIHVVTVNGCTDLQHSVVPPSTGYLRGAEVLAYESGLVLRFGDCCEPLEPKRQDLLLECYRETRHWNETIRVRTVGELNARALAGSFEEVVRVSEALHEKRIGRIADLICSAGSRVVCIAGPSSSGKSTFLKRLATQLRVNGYGSLTLSLDNYYRDRQSEEEVDLESPEALDWELLNANLEQLLEGKECALPTFDFSRQRRALIETWRQERMASDSFLVIEGLHALSREATRAVAPSPAYRIFVSALTQLTIDEHNRIPTSKVRLLRRIVRDRKFRNSSTEQVLEQWPNVRAGEQKYIFPYQDQVDCLFNSSLVYEGAVLKTFAWRYLLEVPKEHPTQGEAFRLLKFLELFVPVLPDVVPNNSLLQEFISHG